MLKTSRDPYGYKNLLAYKKAEELQARCSELTHLFPKLKTLIALGDQMDRSARSVKQNIVEGWKRNSTKEYYEFLGFAIAANAELEEDCADIWRGIYPELMGIKGVMGERGKRDGGGEIGKRGEKSEIGVMGVKGIMGEKGKMGMMERKKETEISSSSSSHSPHSTPLSHFSLLDIENLSFYPLDTSLPSIIQLKLRAKELNFLLGKLQKSLEQKMLAERTLPSADRFKKLETQQHNNKKQYEELLAQQGLIRLENGQVVEKNEPQ